jgi:hypothetical protein
MSYIGRLFGYGQPDASTPPPPSGPELTPGWEVYKNQRGEILYGNNLIRECDFSAPVVQAPLAQAQTASVVQAQQVPQTLQKRNFDPRFDQAKTNEEFLAKGHVYGYYNGGLKRKQSKRKRMQSRRKQSKCKRKRMQSRRRS